jgi:hypothetical protein
MAATHERTDVTFRSGDADCAAWLYRPAGERSRPGPAVVLGHGLGAIKEMGLDAYAERFVEAGYTVLMFDYRHFGASGGEPRQVLDIERQLADWAAAIAYARSLPDVDPERMAIFGSSFGGGHAIVTAARDPRIAAAIAQCPFTSGTASSLTIGPVSTAKLSARAARDEIARLRHAEPVRVGLAGPRGSAALMTPPDALPGYLGLVPPGTDFTNEVAARIVPRLMLHHPGRSAKRVRCPILFCVCDSDSVAPAATTVRYASKAPRGEIVRYPIGHFDIYKGEPLERAIDDQLAFLRRHIPVNAAPAEPRQLNAT